MLQKIVKHLLDFKYVLNGYGILNLKIFLLG